MRGRRRRVCALLRRGWGRPARWRLGRRGARRNLAPRRPVSHSSRSTSPHRCIRASWWDRRLCEEIAAALSFLCSPDSSYLTAHALVVDGGVTHQPGRNASWMPADHSCQPAAAAARSFHCRTPDGQARAAPPGRRRGRSGRVPGGARGGASARSSLQHSCPPATG
ncbi:SDR family oxidoreductase [Streptomyces sp. SD31]|uniref:SDR family oxidoreductase n=1 Tax=Streptomyces sp. SD31 TaxID=3452208 RepID=UPI003F88F7EC